MCKNTIKVISFILIVIFCSGFFIKAFHFKYGDGIYPLDVFYKQKEDSIDVMCFGSSHIFENVNTGVLWDEYGIASFNLCGSVQPLWNTYYYMKEALKTQTPKVMIVDVYRALEDREYADQSRIIKNNYGLKFSGDKINSIKVSAPKEEWVDYFLEYPTYHSRYNELTREDFVGSLGLKDFENWKGFGLNTMTTPFTAPENISTSEIGSISPKTEEYLQKIIDLSKEKSVPLLLIKTPYYTNIDDEKIYNRVQEIADSKDIPFIDFNMIYEQIGLNFSTDFADGDHLNHKGNVKFSDYLGKYLKGNYNIPDRRNDEAYVSYDIIAQNVRQRLYNQKLVETNDIGTYIDLTQNHGYLVVFSVVGEFRNSQNYADVKEKLLEIGINIDEAESDAVWIKENNEIIYNSVNQQNFIWHRDLGDDNRLMVKKDIVFQVNFNNATFSSVENGLNIMVYDKVSGELVESIGFENISDMIQYIKKS